jgi:hypothetical protein
MASTHFEMASTYFETASTHFETASTHFEMASTRFEAISKQDGNASRADLKAPLLSKEGWPKAGVVVSSNYGVVPSNQAAVSSI